MASNAAMTSEADKATMQFVFRRAVDEAVLVPELERILGFSLDPIDRPPGTADALYSIERFSQGFAMYIALYWNAKVQPLIDNVQAALRLAKFSENVVVTDLPEDHPEHAVPGMWCTAEPDGRLFVVSEDDAYDLSQGLVLIESSRRPLS